MSIRGACGVVFAAAILTMGSLPGREKAVFAAGEPRPLVERLEAEVAAHPGDIQSRTALAHAYLDGGSPGLALRTLAEAPGPQRDAPAVQHMEARVLIEQGKAADALALEKKVLATCGDGSTTVAGCDSYLVISATRRADILGELVQRGIEDAVAQPEASLVAYHSVSHDARLAVAP
jgi:hypothetical protein